MSQVRQFTKYDRTDLGDGLVSWVYKFWNPQPISVSTMASGIELGVQIVGEWTHIGRTCSKINYEPGSIYRINWGEQYKTRFCEKNSTGVQVGFIFYPEETVGFADSDSDLVLPGDSGVNDRSLTELARWCGTLEDMSLARTDCHAIVRQYLRRYMIQVPKDPLQRAKDRLDRSLPEQVPLRDIAEQCQLSTTTFTRQFKKRFGSTPAHYRLLARLNIAGRMTWSKPEMSIESIAWACGFSDLPYFYRTFKSYFRSSPGDQGRRN